MRAGKFAAVLLLSALVFLFLAVGRQTKASAVQDAGSTPCAVSQAVYQSVYPQGVKLADNILQLYDDKGWTNVVQAAKYLQGTVVQPGAVFSFNSVVGERTVERGFVEGPVVVWDGCEYVEGRDIGGGVCRLSTAVFRAAYDAGIAPLERHSHSIRQNYAAPGWDAAVAWGVWDYRFVNPYPYPLKIVVNLRHRIINVQIYGIDAS